MNPEMLKAAVGYTKRGLVVHPLSKPEEKGDSPGKKPVLFDWQNLTQTPDDLGVYIKRGCNIGVVCGGASDITVLDLDHFLFVDDIFDGFDLETLRSRRIDGRGHVYFKHNPNLPASKHHDLGIEVLSDGNNVVVPPSTHASGDVYRWDNPDAPIIAMPRALEDNLKRIFQTETELKQVIGKTRTCFKSVLKDKKDMHGAEGREYMLAVCTDMKAAGANEQHIKMFAKLMYEKEYDEQRTLKEWRNIDAAKTWRCNTLKAKLPTYIDLSKCDKCEPKAQENEHHHKEHSQASALIKYVEAEGVELFHDENHITYARIGLDAGNNAIFPTKGSEFRRWLANQYYTDTGSAPGSEAINNAMNVIEAKASYGGKEHKLYNRICWHDGAIWYDLGNWTAVKITSHGWEIIKIPPILFQHFRHQKAGCKLQIMEGTSQNAQSSDVMKVLEFINIKDEKERLLFVVYLVSCYVPDIPHVIPILHGEKGASKSTLFKIVKELVDPSTLRLATFPKDNNELVQRLAHHYFIGFDNVSTISDWQSDALCRAVTGEGFSKRALYTDDEDIIYTYQRCIGLNGINVVATKADLLDRSILLKLERIPKKQRKTEAQLWQAFDTLKNDILTGIFTTISKAMALHPSIKLDELPRMADFTVWGSAIAEALGYGKDAFLEAYTSNIQAQNREAIEGSPVGELIIKFMEDKQEWKGKASGLLTLLEGLAEVNKINIKAKDFPKAANSLTRRLNEIKTNLTDEGIFFEQQPDGKRTIRLWKNIVNSVNTVKPQAGNGIKTDDTLESYRRWDNEISSGIKNKKESDDIKQTKNGISSVVSSVKNQEGETLPDDTNDTIDVSRIVLECKPSMPEHTTNNHPQTELTKLLFDYQARWGKGQVNSSNDTDFSSKFVEIYKPQWQSNGETGYYTPSAIKGIVDKVFKITPTGNTEQKHCFACNTPLPDKNDHINESHGFRGEVDYFCDACFNTRAEVAA